MHPKICGLQNSETLLVNYFNNDLAVYPAASIFYRDDIIEVGVTNDVKLRMPSMQKY